MLQKFVRKLRFKCVCSSALRSCLWNVERNLSKYKESKLSNSVAIYRRGSVARQRLWVKSFIRKSTSPKVLSFPAFPSETPDTPESLCVCYPNKRVYNSRLENHILMCILYHFALPNCFHTSVLCVCCYCLLWKQQRLLFAFASFASETVPDFYAICIFSCWYTLGCCSPV